jgi:hypothetical protein
VIPETATGLTSALGGISNLGAEAGVAIFSMAFAAVPLMMLAFLWRRVLASFGGRAAEGTVTQVERSSARLMKVHVTFRASDGREISVPLAVAPGARAGDTVHIRYNPARPEVATNRTAPAVTTHVLLPLGALAAVGLTGLVGTFWSVATGGFDGFLSAYAIVVFAAFGAISLFVAYGRYAEIKAAQPVTGPSLKAGNVLGPTLAGLILIAAAALLAVVFYGS